MKQMHIYGQSAWHDEAYIVGDKEALTGLREAIDRALETGRSHSEQFVNDGEGYNAVVVCVSPEVADKLMLPYTDETAEERHPDVKVKHWTLNKREEPR